MSLNPHFCLQSQICCITGKTVFHSLMEKLAYLEFHSKIQSLKAKNNYYILIISIEAGVQVATCSLTESAFPSLMPFGNFWLTWNYLCNSFLRFEERIEAQNVLIDDIQTWIRKIIVHILCRTWRKVRRRAQCLFLCMAKLISF